MKNMINPKVYVEKLFKTALYSEKNISVLRETHNNTFGYYDENADYKRIYYFDDTIESIVQRILMDKEVESFLPKDAFAVFLFETIDSNAIMVMEKLVLLWDNDEGMSSARNILENEYGDEYAQYIAEGNLLGQTWTDRQIPVVNVSSIYQSCKEIFMPGIDGTFSKFFIESLLQTIFHELRHLFYECNEIVNIGPDTDYPQDGGLEDHVEDYGNNMANQYLKTFSSIILNKPLKQQ